MIFNIYIFNKHGTPIYYEEWHRKKPAKNLAEEQKLMFGMLFSLKSFVTKTSPKPIDEKTGFHYYKTSTYKLHFYETPTSVKFIILTDPNTPDLREELKRLHSAIYVEYVVKNPLYKLGDVIKCELFISSLQKFIKNLPSFAST
eukprot:Phypoly_transcript_02581.p4 GENE.Phypoly_transcript_02581~~Phypoly_transcript_02581.p4  ORF type:complete len:144 (+),score=30.30 Phypoly_transcript_02581:2304-2735(+)